MHRLITNTAITIMGIALALLFMAGCSNDDCEDQIKDITNKYGKAEEVNTYNSGDYHNMDLWYWSKGFQYSFTWGNDIKGCEVSKYTFTPITKTAISDSIKTVVNDSMILDYRELCPNMNMLTQ